MNNSVQTKGVGAKRPPISIGYLIIPEGVERVKYVQDCYRRGEVALQMEDGSVIFEVPVEISTLQILNFPNETKMLGSAVICASEYIHNKLIVIGRLLKGDESNTIQENEFRFEKFTETGSVSISGKGSDGNLFISVNGKTEDGGKIFVDVINSDGLGEVVLNLQGNLKAEIKSILIEALEEINISSINDLNINSKEGLINLGDNTEELEAALLGSKTITELQKEVDALTSLLNTISNITPVNVVSGSPDATWATWQLAVTAITGRADYSKIKSEKLFLE